MGCCEANDKVIALKNLIFTRMKSLQLFPEQIIMQTQKKMQKITETKE